MLSCFSVPLSEFRGKLELFEYGIGDLEVVRRVFFNRFQLLVRDCSKSNGSLLLGFLLLTQVEILHLDIDVKLDSLLLFLYCFVVVRLEADRRLAGIALLATLRPFNS